MKIRAMCSTGHSFRNRIVFSLLIGIFLVTNASSEVSADIQGFFETHIQIFPQTTTSEQGLIEFDIQNDLTVNISLSGLRNSIHTHFGIAGVEDLILSTDGSFGIVQISADLVFARFASGSLNPFYPTLHFLKKQVNTRVLIGGVTFENLATYEDTAAFLSQTPAFAFGNVFSISGSTPSGTTLTSQVSICKERVANIIKKHVLAAFSVSPDCATQPKSDQLFEFSRLTVTNVPISGNVSASAVLDCFRINACDLTITHTISGGIIPFQTQLFFRDIFNTITWNGVSIFLSYPSGFLTILFGQDGLISQVRGVLSVTLNPEENPADYSLRYTWSPGSGLTDASVTIAITRGMLRLTGRADFQNGPTLRLNELNVDLSGRSDLILLSITSRLEPKGLIEARLIAAIFF